MSLLYLVVVVVSIVNPILSDNEGTEEIDEDTSKTQIKEKVHGIKRLLNKNNADFYATCDLVLFSTLVDFDTAETKCSEFNLGSTKGAGNLATVNNEDRNKQITTLLEMAYPGDGLDKWESAQWSWAGMRKVTNNDGTRASKAKGYIPTDWEWADQSNPQDFEKWMNRQPDQQVLTDGNKGCNEEKCIQNQMRINHKGQWDDTYKFKLHPYACDWTGKYIISSKKKKWEKALELCLAAGLILAEVRNAQDQADIEAAALLFLGPQKEGTRTFNQENWYWIGGMDDVVEGTFRWEYSDTLVQGSGNWTIPWFKRQPDNAPQGQHKLAINKGGLWDDSKAHKKKPFACMCPSAVGATW